VVEIPAPVLEEHAGVLVVRDDLVPGGTKARYLAGLFAQHDRVAYASPAYGGAQLALAYCARAANKEAVIFVAKRKDPHPRTLEARAVGARVFQVPHGYLSNVQAKAKLFAGEQGAHYLEFGGESEQALEAIAAAARVVWEQRGPFDEVWCAAGSGVLTRGLQRGMPDAGVFFAVQVGRDVDRPGRAKVIPAGLPFEREDRREAPFPSCPNYDRKAWHACTQRRGNGARVLFWNVMGPSPTGHAVP
jgi:hypothetical protein